LLSFLPSICSVFLQAMALVGRAACARETVHICGGTRGGARIQVVCTLSISALLLVNLAGSSGCGLLIIDKFCRKRWNQTYLPPLLQKYAQLVAAGELMDTG
jgi:hypothetical protein